MSAATATPSINQAEVPTPRVRSRVGTVRLPGTEEIYENFYQAPDPGQISIPNPGLRTKPGVPRYNQTHGRADWEFKGFGDNSGQSVSFHNHFGPYSERAEGPNTGPGRVAIGRRQPVTQLTESS